MLSTGFYDVAEGHLATVVTHLEMLQAADPRACAAPDGLTLRHVNEPDLDWYRALFLKVGGIPWLWFSRLTTADSDMRFVLGDPNVEVHGLFRDDEALGLLELDFRDKGACELALFGVVPELTGTTAGRFLMNAAIARAWARDIVRFHVHTCTLDHPRALRFYRRSGFTPVRQEVEVLADPRLSGVLPREAAPHIPMFG